MKFFKKFSEKRKFKKDLKKAQILNQPLEEDIVSLVYSSKGGEMHVLVVERSDDLILWPGMKQFGSMCKVTNDNSLSDLFIDLKSMFSLNMDLITFNKEIKNVEYLVELPFDLKKEFNHISSYVYMVEIDDYVLKSMRGYKSDTIKSVSNIPFRDFYDYVQKNKLNDVKDIVQPHYAHALWRKATHQNLLRKYYECKKNDLDIFEFF